MPTILPDDKPTAPPMLLQRYRGETGHDPYVFRRSSAGAAAFGHLRLLRRRWE